MFRVVIRPGAYPSDTGEMFLSERIESVPTLEHARELVRSVFPRAVFTARWMVLFTRPERGWDPTKWIAPTVQMPDGCSMWWESSIQVFPNSTWLELDQRRERECGLIYNETNEPPEPGARLFYGSRQLLDV